MRQDAIASTLLAAVHKEAGLSLEPLLILVAALARDLQADFLSVVPRLASALTELVEQGAHVLMAARSMCLSHAQAFLQPLTRQCLSVPKTAIEEPL